MSLERQQQEQRAHELALRAADYEGQAHAGHHNVASKVAEAYAEAYKTCMRIGESAPTPIRHAFSAQSFAYSPVNSVFIHKDGSVHSNPEY